MKRYFTTEEEDQSEQIRVKAIKRGTVTGRAGTFHFDPNGRDPKARKRTVPFEIAFTAKEKGLVEYISKTSETEAMDIDDQRIGAVGARRRETSIGAGGEEPRIMDMLGASGGDTRDTTAFAADPSKSARVSPGRVIRLGERREPDEELEDLDDDEENGDGDDGEGDGTDATGTFPSTDAMAQEGNAGGADAPPRGDDVSDHSGTDQGAGVTATDGSGIATDQTDDGTQAVAIEAADGELRAPAAAAPKPRERRGSRNVTAM